MKRFLRILWCVGWCSYIVLMLVRDRKVSLANDKIKSDYALCIIYKSEVMRYFQLAQDANDVSAVVAYADTAEHFYRVSQDLRESIKQLEAARDSISIFKPFN